MKEVFPSAMKHNTEFKQTEKLRRSESELTNIVFVAT